VVTAYLVGFGTAVAQSAPTYQLDIPAESLSRALKDFSVASSQQLVFSERDVSNHSAPALHGSYTRDQALAILLSGTDLRAETSPSGVLMVRSKNVQAASNSDGAATSTTPATIETVVVTGTVLHGLTETASPMRSLDRGQIDAGGFTTTAEIIQSLPENFGGGINVGTTRTGTTFNSSSNRGYASSANLYGLGSDATLTLLNGVRLPAASEGYSVDISMIPISAIQRVDVLKDGASSTYGSDAVAGVVNFVTLKDFDGAKTSVTAGSVTSGQKLDYQVNQLVGTTWDSGGVLATYTYDRQDSLSAGSRSCCSTTILPSFVLPESDTNSIYATGHQTLMPGLELNAEILWTDRHLFDEGGFVSSIGPALAQTKVASSTVLVRGGLSYQLGASWLLQVNGRYDTSATTYDALADVDDDEFKINYNGTEYAVDARADGELFQLPAGAARLALGTTYRSEGYKAEGLFNLRRDIWALYTEAFFPLVGDANAVPGIRRLELTGSLRYESYSDFGSTTNPKVGLLWKPVDELTLRTTYSTSFRAPLLPELAESERTAFLANLPDPLSGTGKSLGLYEVGGNPTLRPETARNFTAGATWAPEFADNLQLSASYFNIHFDNRIEQPGGGILITTQPTIYGAFINRSPTLQEVNLITSNPLFLNLAGPFTPASIKLIADARLQNVSTVGVQGLDFSADYVHELFAGTADFSLDATDLLNYQETLLAGTSAIDRLNTPYYPVDFRLRAGTSWSRDGWKLSAFLNYVDSYKDNQVAGIITPVSSWTTVDAQIAYDFGSGGSSALSNTSLALSVTNLFDQDPPFVQNQATDNIANAFNYDATNASPLGRFISIRLTHTW